ncbi:MAG: SAM-dependent methyltransferase, partial [Pseudomonadota bacterium]
MAQRLDQALVALGLAPSRARAQAMLEAGVVTVEGVVTRKPALKIGDQAVAVTGAANPWVSRAALKLVHALDHFGLEPQGVAADLGASTGGFTQVLLARGAA